MEKEHTAAEKQAIIILPGIMGSEIFAKDDITVKDTHFSAGERLWAPEAKDGFHIDEKILALAMTAEGEPVYPTYAAPPMGRPDGAGHYGTGDAYRNLYHGLSRRFRTSVCDVVFYSYDWRLGLAGTAKALDDFIREHRYQDIVFIAHSMGGLVSSAYLAMGEEQRTNTRLHISLGTPYLGAEKMVSVYGSGKILDGSFFAELANLIIDLPIREIIPNIPSVYALFPPKYRFRPYLLAKTGTLYPDHASTVSALMACFPAFNGRMMAAAETALSGIFIADHPITACVPSFYIVGSGTETPRTVTLSEKGDDCCRAAISGEDPTGDGTVGLYSATAAAAIDRRRIFCLCAGAQADPAVASHTGMVACRDGGAPLPLLIDLIRGTVTEKTPDAILTSRYGVCRI